MTTQIISDPASLQRLGMLLESMELRRAHYERIAQAHRDGGNVHDAYDAQQMANHAAWVAYRVRGNMATISGLTVADVEPPPHLHTPACPITDCPFKPAEAAALAADEPPLQLVPFVEWLRSKLGKVMPWVPADIWQAVGCALLTCRPGWRL